MVYESTTDVMLGVYVKLQKQKESAMKKIQELTFQIRLLELKDNDVDLEEELIREKNAAQSKYDKADKQVKLIQKDRDGGASLDPFLAKEVEFVDTD